MPPTGPPFIPFAPIVTELFRLWSADDPFVAELLWAIAGAETAGTAGEIAGLPFIGEIELLFPCCTGPEPPTATAGEGVEELVAFGGDETAFFAVEAYDRVGCDALVEFGAWLGICDCWETEVIELSFSKATSCDFRGRLMTSRRAERERADILSQKRGSDVKSDLFLREAEDDESRRLGVEGVEIAVESKLIALGFGVSKDGLCRRSFSRVKECVAAGR